MKKFRCTTITFTSYESDEKTTRALDEDSAIWYLYGHELTKEGRPHL